MINEFPINIEDKNNFKEQKVENCLVTIIKAPFRLIRFVFSSLFCCCLSSKNVVEKKKSSDEVVNKTDVVSSKVISPVNKLKTNSILNKAVTHLNSRKDVDESTKNEAIKVLGNLGNRINSKALSSIPRYYHSTGRHAHDQDGAGAMRVAKDIIEDKKIKASNGSVGYGAFVSTNDESELYGAITFAFTSDVVEKNEADYFIAPQARCSIKEENKYQSTWVQVKSDLEFEEKNIAWIIVDEQYIEDAKDKFSSSCTVISRKVANLVRHSLDSAQGKKFEKPENWKVHEKLYTIHQWCMFRGEKKCSVGKDKERF